MYQSGTFYVIEWFYEDDIWRVEDVTLHIIKSSRANYSSNEHQYNHRVLCPSAIVNGVASPE